jgi:pyroglutamyl-peptidase
VPTPEPGAPRLLLTVFEPFGKSKVNASQLVGEALAARHQNIELLVLPVVRGEAEKRLLERLATAPAPTVILSLGEAGPEPAVRLEKVAINYDDFRIPDNAKNRPRAEPIRADGPAAYFSTLPVEQIAQTVKAHKELPVVVSLSAGAFLCNHIAYCALDHLAAHPLCPYLFIHLPRWRKPMGKKTFRRIVSTVRRIVSALPEGIIGV